jgi:methyltransferase (TIGR00027 family)
MNLSAMSRTAIFTLICRVIAASQKPPLITDPVALVCYDQLIKSISKKEQKDLLKYRRRLETFGKGVIKSMSSRVVFFDQTANRFMADHPECTVVNLACGFDTRYWRLDHENCAYKELDLPAVINLKKQLLDGLITYEQISCSVLDYTWIDQVTKNGHKHFHLIAEGLFMYLEERDAKNLIKEIAERFTASQLTFDILSERYVRGLWKKPFEWQVKFFTGLPITYSFGFKQAADVERYSEKLKVFDQKKTGMGWYITVRN